MAPSCITSDANPDEVECVEQIIYDTADAVTPPGAVSAAAVRNDPPIGGLCLQLRFDQTYIYNRFESCQVMYLRHTLYYRQSPVGEAYEDYYVKFSLNSRGSRDVRMDTAALQHQVSGQERVTHALSIGIQDSGGLDVLSRPNPVFDSLNYNSWLTQTWVLRSGGDLLERHTPTTFIRRNHPNGPRQSFGTRTQPSIRCDSAQKSGVSAQSSVGCVFEGHRPTLFFSAQYSAYGPYPEVARHIQDSINSGYPNVLTRDLAGTSSRRNAATRACQRVAVPETECDEYPFASTAEGGTGSSVRRVNANQNSNHGADYGQQLYDNRVFDQEQFRVVVTP